MTATENSNDLYEVILIESDDDFAVICPGIPGAISQGKDREEALKMIADAMAMCRMYPLPGEESEARREELRQLGKAKIAELVAECERDGWKYEVHQVRPQLIQPNWEPGKTPCLGRGKPRRRLSDRWPGLMELNG